MIKKVLILLSICLIATSLAETTANISSSANRIALATNNSVEISNNLEISSINISDLISLISTTNIMEIKDILSTASISLIISDNDNYDSTLALPYNTVVIDPPIFHPQKYTLKRDSNKQLTSTLQDSIITDKASATHEKPTENVTAWKDFNWDVYDNSNDNIKITPFMSGSGEVKMYSLKISGTRESAVQDSIYQDLMRRVKEVDFQIESRFNLLLQAKINEEAEVNYNIVQEPNMPQKTDVNLRIRQTNINFGTLVKTYNLGNFSNISKRIDGISLMGREGPFNYNFGFGQAKSQNDYFTRNGNGSSEYPLRYKPVLENTLRVYVNDAQLVENKDYQINYFEGKVIFKAPLLSQDNMSFYYEYTNPIEDFIPIANNVNFLGISGEYSPQTEEQLLPVIEDISDSFLIITNNYHLQLSKLPIIIGSEKITAKGQRLARNLDYYMHYTDGKILLLNKDIVSLNVQYRAQKVNNKSEAFMGTSKSSVYYLKNTPLLENSEEIFADDIRYKKDIDYKIDYTSGKIFFLYPVHNTTKISINYKQKILIKSRLGSSDPTSQYNLKFGYFKEFAKAQKDTNTKLASDTYITPSKNLDGSVTIVLSNWPVVADTFTLLVNNVPISSNQMTTNFYEGIITINSSVFFLAPSNYTIVAGYYYYKEYGPAQWFFSGVDPDMENMVFYNNKSAHRLLSKFDQPVKHDRNNILTQVEYRKSGQTIYQNLIFGKDYTIVYDSNGVNPGQLSILLYNLYIGADNIVYGVPSNLTSLDLFRVTYRYNKSNIPDPGDISNEQFEMVYQQVFSNEFDIAIDISKTAKEYSRSFQTATSFLLPSPNGQYGYTYGLANNNIIENSEVVYINNEPKAFKNEHYYINYASGKITFINLNPSPSDNIYVKYSYYTTASGENLQKVKKEGTAINLKTKYSNSFSNSFVELTSIEDNFAPMGPQTFAPGSNVFNLSTIVKPYSNLQILSSYLMNQRNLEVVNLSGKKIKQNDEKFVGEANYKPLSDVAIIYHFERENSISQPDNTTSANLRPVDSIAYRNNINMTVGPQFFQTNFILNNYTYRDNYLDNFNMLDKMARSWVVDNKISAFEDNLILRSSLSETNELDSTPISYNRKLRETYFKKYGFSLGVKPLSFVNINGAYNTEMQESVTSFDAQNKAISSNRSLTSLQNYQYGVNLAPPIYLYLMDNPNYQFSLSNTERASLLVNHTPDTAYGIGNQISWKFINLTNVSYRDNSAIAWESDKNINRESYSKEYNIGGFLLFSNSFPLQIQNTSKRVINATNFNYITRNDTIYNEGDNSSIETKYGFSWQPIDFFKYSNDYYLIDNFSHTTENKTAELLKTYQSYPKQNTKQTIDFSLTGLLKSQFVRDYTLQENYKEILSYSTANTSLLNYTAYYNNSTHFLNQNLNNVLLPNTFPINLNFASVYDDYVDSIKGLKYRQADQYQLNTAFLYEGYSISPRFSNSNTVQYLKASADVKLQDIMNNNYNSYLFNQNSEAQLDLAKKLTAQYSLLMNYGYRKIMEESENPPPTRNKSIISVHTLGIGLQASPITYVMLSYVFNFKTNIDEIINKAYQNYSDILIAEYKPVLVQSAKFSSNISVTFKREHSWGVGLNDFAKVETNQASNISIVTVIKEINNITSTAVVAANIEIPMTERSNGNIDKFIFTAEGNYVEKADLTGTSNLNYSIVSFIFSGKLVF